MRILLLAALFAVACGSNPGDEMIRCCASNMQVDVMKTGQIMKDHPEVVKYANSRGTTPLHASAGAWNYIVSHNLIKAGADVNARDKDGNTPLHLALRAIEGQNYGAGKGLPGTPLTKEQQQARSQLQAGVAVAQSRNREDLVRLLLVNKADVSLPNNQGQTPLQVSDQAEEVYRTVMRELDPDHQSR